MASAIPSHITWETHARTASISKLIKSEATTKTPTMAADADDDGDDDWNMKSNVRIFSRIIYSAKEIDELVSV